MKTPYEGLYRGEVVHSRVQPVRHKLRYRVFACLFDCDGFDALDERLRLFSYNRPNLFSLYDRDHGDKSSINSYLRGVAQRAGMGEVVTRFLMLCYPRIAGYAFNPLTVYYGVDRFERVRLVIYEVNNTFGGRQNYVLAVKGSSVDGLIVQTCAKSMRVSPFNGEDGNYIFHLTPPGESLVVGVALRDTGGPLLKAHFRGRREPLTDRTLLRALAKTGWMTVRVIVAIHWEALKLWRKGVRAPRPVGEIAANEVPARMPAKEKR